MNGHPSLSSASEVAQQLAVDPAVGLSDDEARRRLAADGPNELRATARMPVWRRILNQFNNPLVILLLVAVVVSVVAWLVEGADHVPVDAIAITAIVVLNAVLGFVQEARAENAVAALSELTAANSTVLRSGALRTIPSAELVCGDILVLTEGDAVGADARVLSASTLRVAEASLTGESEAVTKSSDTLAGEAMIGDRVNMVFKGSAVVSGVARAIVTRTGMATEVGSIARMLDETTSEATPLQREFARIGRMLGVLVVIVAIVVMAAVIVVNGVSTPADFVVVLLLGVSLAVAAVPEGLPAILSVVLAVGVQRMARRHAVVKELDSVETLGAASVICTDKTGTLTRNEMTIPRLQLASGRVDITGSGYTPMGEVLSEGRPLEGDLLAEAQLLLRSGALANNAQLAQRDGSWTIEGDPTEAAFLVAAQKLAGLSDHVGAYERDAEVPFTSERRLMSTLHHHREAGSVRVYSKGAADALLVLCTHLRRGEQTVPLTATERARILREVDDLSAQAYRVLGVAYRHGTPAEAGDDTLEHDLVFAGLAALIDPPRSEVASAIAQARQAGIRVIMITGDHPLTAARIALDLGIADPGARTVTGVELEHMDDAALRDATREVSVFARVAPAHKLRLVDALQADGHIVAMTGDGVNDAPALKSADIGIAMGITGTEVTKEAARMILADDNFATIVAAVRQGRAIFDNIQKFLRYLLTTNMGEVLTVLLGVVFAGALGFAGASPDAVVLPLLATQILWINLVSDSTPAFALGIDREVDDVMARPPRRIDDRAIDWRLWVGVVSGGVVLAVITLASMDAVLPGGFIPGTGSFDLARTAGFTTLVFAQIFSALNARSATTSAVHGLFRNRWLWAAFALTAGLQVAVVHVPFLQVAFSTVPMDAAHWALCVALASLILVYGELVKLVRRALARRTR